MGLIVAVVTATPRVDEDRPLGGHDELPGVSDVVGEYRRAEALWERDAGRPARARRRCLVCGRLSKDLSCAQLSHDSACGQGRNNPTIFLTDDPHHYSLEILEPKSHQLTL